MTEIVEGKITHSELTKNSKGGSELLAERMVKHLDGVLDEYQIIFGRVETLMEDKLRILYCHDLAEDPQGSHLLNEGWKKFHKIVFVSEWQKDQFIGLYNIPPSHTMVIHNAIVPIEEHKKAENKIRLGYWSTPHRGLELLVPAFEELQKRHKGLELELDIFSSFEIYGWKQKDAGFEPIFAKCRTNPQINYHGSVDNETLREKLKDIHILAYPNIWKETSCMVLMEAMSAGIACVHPNYAALPETAANWTFMYNFNEDVNKHCAIFYNALKSVIENYHTEMVQWKLGPQKSYADTFYHVGRWRQDWIALLTSDIKEKSRKLPSENNFSYSAG